MEPEPLQKKWGAGAASKINEEPEPLEKKEPEPLEKKEEPEPENKLAGSQALIVTQIIFVSYTEFRSYVYAQQLTSSSLKVQTISAAFNKLNFGGVSYKTSANYLF